MFGKLGRFVARHPLVVLGFWLAAGLAAYCFAPTFEDRCLDDDVHFLPPRCLSVQGLRLLQEAFPQEAYGSKLILACERADHPLTEGDLSYVAGLVRALRRFAQTDEGGIMGTVAWHGDPLIGTRLLSADRHCTLVLASLETTFLAQRTGEFIHDLEREVASAAAARPPGLEVAWTGPAAIGRDLNEAAHRSLEHTTWATLVLIIVILLLIYRAPILACIPLCTIGAAVWLSLRVLALLTLLPDVHVINVTRIFVVVVLYGAGTDYCLFLVSRYREELQKGLLPPDAVAESIRRVGGALLASAATIIVGLGLMGFAEFAKLRYVGPAVALCLFIAFVASLTLAPALLALFGRRAFWPFRLEQPSTNVAAVQPSPFWERFSGWVTSRPLAIWAGSMLLLLPLAWLGMRTECVFNITAELPADAPSRRGIDVIQRHFTAGEIGPLTILLESQEPWDGPEGRALLGRLARAVGDVPNVAEVRSLVRPLGNTTLSPLAEMLGRPLARKHYLARQADRQVTRLDVVFHTDPFANESIATMLAVRDRIEREMPEHPGRIALYGITPLTYDISDVHHADRLRINALVLAGIYLILLGIVRRPVLAAYLLATVLFSYYVTIGATELLSLGWLDGQVGKIDWKVPFFLFTILVAIGEDYNIFLMTRVLEETRRNGWRAGVRAALARTGGTITSCGLIMAGTFATLMLCPLAALAQLGLALTFGVLLDTFVVRATLVPTFLLLLERARPASSKSPVIPFPERTEMRRTA